MKRLQVMAMGAFLCLVSACSDTGGRQEEPPKTTRYSAVEEAASQALTTVEGQIGYSVPDEMRVGKPETVQVRISRLADDDIATDLRKSNAVIGKAIEVGDHMRVNLVGTAFDITALTPEEQRLLGRGYTQWQWDVVPKTGGRQTLTFAVSIVFIESGRAFYMTREVDRQSIDVSVNYPYQVKQFVGRNKEWLWTAIVVPVVPVVFNYIRKKRKQKGTSYEPD